MLISEYIAAFEALEPFLSLAGQAFFGWLREQSALRERLTELEAQDAEAHLAVARFAAEGSEPNPLPPTK